MLEDSDAYYSRKDASWILENSCPDYMLKVFPKFVFCHANLYVQTLVETTYKLNKKCVPPTGWRMIEAWERES